MKQLSRDQMKKIRGGDQPIDCCGCDIPNCFGGQCMMVDGKPGFHCNGGFYTTCEGACSPQTT